MVPAVRQPAALNKQSLLRLATAGSVDDGKSTLIGRLLLDSKAIFDDQLSALARTSLKRGMDGIDLSLLTDGLAAEREQGITIDVAYRYFATAARKFIIADTPGHEQYTRNMATGASTADLSVILVDATKGVLVQSRRHAIIASLLGVRHLVIVVNKMDLAAFAEQIFQAIRADFGLFLGKLGAAVSVFVPISALHGDNVVGRSSRMPWYEGPTLLEVLQGATPADASGRSFRFPVQLVSRPQQGRPSTRGYLGRIESGVVRPGDRVAGMPGGWSSTVKEILAWGEGCLNPQPAARAPQSVTLVLNDEIDVSRGDMIVAADAQPRVASGFEAILCWLDNTPLDTRRSYVAKHATRTTKAFIRSVQSRVDVNTALESRAGSLGLNEIGRARLATQAPLAFDRYRDDRATGGFILIDEVTNHTVAAGMITGG